ncbi:hypothetical protein AB0K20_29805 [Micromonospora matsumotoense]|uniref:hypothetical protein n=1 Tax=Micromonospora matsumotoense TaxID=121616 RepID=UPI00343B4037
MSTPHPTDPAPSAHPANPTSSARPAEPTPAADPTPPTGLAARQAALVATLVAGAPVPAGFVTDRVDAARAALLRKRAGEVARHWPLLAAGLGDAWWGTFRDWAAGRPTAGSLRDGWDLARELRDRGVLPPLGAEELVVREAAHHYDGEQPPRHRRLPAFARTGGAVALQFAGRVRLLRPARR